MKTVQCLLIALGILCMAACSEDNGSGDGATDTVDDTCKGCGAPYETSFVVSQMKIGSTDQGFNLDDVYTQCTDGTCIPDGNNGVDNRLSEILAAVENAAGEDFDADTAINDNIKDGSMLVVFRFLDVEVTSMASVTSSDPTVQLKGYLGLDTDDPEDAADNFSGSEPMDIDSRSLTSASDIEASLISFAKCSLRAGKLECDPDRFNLDLDIQDSALKLEIEQAQLIASVTTSPEDNGSGVYVGGTMKEGLLGGYVPIRNLQDALEGFADEIGDISPTTIQQILANHADIDAEGEGLTDVNCDGPDDCLSWQECRTGKCYEPADQLDSISLAVTFELKSVEFTGNIVVVEE